MTPTERARYGPPTAPNEDAPAPPGTGPGLLDRDCPAPGCDPAPAPSAPDDLLASIAHDTAALLDRCAAKLDDLEARYDATPAALHRAERGPQWWCHE